MAKCSWEPSPPRKPRRATCRRAPRRHRERLLTAARAPLWPPALLLAAAPRALPDYARGWSMSGGGAEEPGGAIGSGCAWRHWRRCVVVPDVMFRGQ
ncbi:hypothetical protein PHYSODRAFT_354187 [Phytophthora sojae]|uniref:Uncharacterized protein n=1 Tax=Phytophthora sojae (strain P6497) TaxID=1094619 RepID=G4Z2W0_PHYSP|nr:hypothetical protein PHYSODRAFT_354187 [Phytophthora sojae]EGZ19293.1 hypothetical protein PHYSODRAFT_354187 [Phytophthora sojae]|eukprot:XP_009522010.1 hypothetical protein PHYSODRAFT_354187 [Phytophthora sojae]